jgi:hypothetical protein
MMVPVDVVVDQGVADSEDGAESPPIDSKSNGMVSAMRRHGPVILDMLRGMMDRAQDEKREFVKRVRGVPVQHSAAVRASGIPPPSGGDMAVRRFFANFDHFGTKERKFEMPKKHREWYMMMFRACIPHFYPNTWESDHRAIMERHEITEVNPWVGFKTPRQFGKTTTVAAFVAAMTDAIPAIEVIVISTTHETARRMKEQIATFFRQIPGNADRVKFENSKVLKFTSRHGENCLTSIESSGDTPDNLRGRQARIAIVDEVAYVSWKMFTSFLLPLMPRGNTSVMCISTVSSDETNHFTGLEKAKNPDTGKPVFAFEGVTYQCPDCKEKKITDCDHPGNNRPRWISGAKQKMLKPLADITPGAYQREILGVGVTSDRAVFSPDILDGLANLPAVPLLLDPRFVYVGIDPTGGGESSDMAIVSMVINAQGEVVVSGERAHAHAMRMCRYVTCGGRSRPGL